MAWLRRLIGGVSALFRKHRVEQELDEELRAYLETSIQEKLRAGMAHEDAIRTARSEMGSLEALKDHTRDVGWESVLESIWQDVRYAIRSLRKSPGFTTVAALTLALGIGATTAIFSLLEAVLLKSLPVKNPEELVLVGGPQYPVFQAFRRHTNIFVDLCATSGVTPLDVEIQNGIREPTDVSLVSGSYFSTLGVQSAIGRVFTVDDDRAPGEHPVAVVSHAYWQRRFGREATILGRVVRISGMPITIIGVAPPGFFGEHVGVRPDLWVPLAMWGHVVPGRNLLQSPSTGWLQMIGRVRPGVIQSGAQPELTETFRQVVAEIFGPNMPDDVRRDTARATITLEPGGKGVSNLRAQFARPLQLLMGAVVLVLLIACANIANLLLARATTRRREIDVRLALGMSRGRLMRQLLTESLVLAALGGALGVALAWLGREALLRLISADASRVPIAVTTDARLLVFVAVISLATAILFGLVPAWQSARASLVTSLVARRETGGRPRQRLSSLLVVAQVALSLVLLMGAGLFLRTIANLGDVDLGFAPQRLLVLDVKPQAAGYRGDRAIALSRTLLDRIKDVPGVSSVSLSEHGVLTGTDNGTNLMRPRGFVAGPEGFPHTRWDVVGPRYFSTIGAPLVSGRDFSERDGVGSPLAVAINEEMARRFFASANPIGQRLVWDVGGGQKELEIVAVTRDVKQSGPRDEQQPRFYLPYFQMPVIRDSWILASTRFLVRTAANPVALAPVLRQLISSEDPRLSVASLAIGPELVSRTLVQERMVATLLVAFGVLAVGLACLGLYGLIAYHVVQRTSEIGIRIALGAQRRDVLWVTLRQGVVWIAGGVAAGVPLALSASQVAQSLLFGLSATDAGTLLGAAGVMSALGLLAAYIPARRAARVDPVVALRAE
ncbi:MAG: FtsX-like permease family protein [Luteitalea sp.]|nr:FtsX-like permease family protein [Luteitalea sp.]